MLLPFFEHRSISLISRGSFLATEQLRLSESSAFAQQRVFFQESFAASVGACPGETE